MRRIEKFVLAYSWSFVRRPPCALRAPAAPESCTQEPVRVRVLPQALRPSAPALPGARPSTGRRRSRPSSCRLLLLLLSLLLLLLPLLVVLAGGIEWPHPHPRAQPRHATPQARARRGAANHIISAKCFKSLERCRSSTLELRQCVGQQEGLV